MTETPHPGRPAEGRWLELPQKLTRENRWALWRPGAKRGAKGRPVLELVQAANPAVAASVEDPYSWASFERACQALAQAQASGLAYVNSRYNPVVAITFYNALKDGKVAPWAMRYLDVLGAYAEEGVVPGSLLLLYEGGSEQPLTWGNVAVRRSPFIALTGRHLPGSPSRVGTSPTRLQAFIDASRRDFERMIERRGGDPKAHMAGKGLERLLSSLKGVRKTGPGRWMALSPVREESEPSLSIRLANGRILLYDFGGASTEEVIRALGIGYGDLFTDETPPDLPPSHPRSASLVRPLEGEMLQRVRQAWARLRELGRLPKAFENRGFGLEAALEGGLGALNEHDGVIVYMDAEGRPLNAVVRRGAVKEGENRFYTLTPGHGSPVWVGPGLLQARAGVVVMEGATNALLVWSLVRQEGLGVIGVPGVENGPARELVARLPLQPIYLYADPHDRRAQVLERWAAPFREQGFPVRLLEPLDPAGRTDANEYAHRYGGQALLERLVELGVGGD